MKKYAIVTGNGISATVSVGITGVNFSVGGKLEHLFRAYRNRPVSRIFRRIADDMLNIEHLGALYEKLQSSIRTAKAHGYSDISITPKYMENKESQHGRPVEL